MAEASQESQQTGYEFTDGLKVPVGARIPVGLLARVLVTRAGIIFERFPWSKGIEMSPEEVSRHPVLGQTIRPVASP